MKGDEIADRPRRTFGKRVAALPMICALSATPAAVAAVADVVHASCTESVPGVKKN
jgi:hypothetical protein